MSCPSCVAVAAGTGLLGTISLLKGIGGAEQLMVYVASSMQKLGYDITIVTSHHDKSHCFPATRDGTLKVEVHGDWIPRAIFGRFHALCALVRMVWCVIVVLFSGRRFEVALNDQLSAINPLLYSIATTVFFYCHFPDKLLCVDRSNPLKRLYRIPLDYLEDYTTSHSDICTVNSNFTLSTVEKAMPKTKGTLSVLYPPVDLPHVKSVLAKISASESHPEVKGELEKVLPKSGKFFLSLNRYERKKGIDISIQSFAKAIESNPEKYKDFVLVIAGGYDHRVKENVEHLIELRQIAVKFNLLKSAKAEDTSAPFIEGTDRISFLRSVSDVARWGLLSNATALMYTPQFEHFGMVPCESMAVGTPVIASASPGGPCETVKHEETGILCEHTVEKWAEGVKRFLDGGDLAVKRAEMGEKCKKRVADLFDLESFTQEIGRLIKVAEGDNECVNEDSKKTQ